MDSSFNYPVLSILTFWPLAAAVLLVLARTEKAVRLWTLAASLIEVVLAWPLLGFRNVSGFQFQELLNWAPQWGLSYSLGVDGISILMIWLSILTLPLCVLCSWTYIGRRVKEFHVCLLLMTTACVGVFSALDLVLFYVFWEALLIPMYLMIAIWGGDERRYASIKFFLYTLAGSTLLLAAIVALRIEGGTFSIPELMNSQFSFNFQYWVFLAFFLAFAIKVPMFPFHTWLPAAHVQAPSAGSVILAAVLLKMGTYGFLRFSLSITPAASQYFAPMMIAISIASILYGGAIALGQKDIKKLIAYSSVAHMGFVTLGIFLFSLNGINGAIFQMLNHGIITGAMFMLIGAVYERSHSREIARNLGLGKYLPAFMFFWGLFGLASFGFPGTNGFVGEFLVIAAAFQSSLTVGLLVIPGALLAAAYILKVTLKMAWGQPASPAGRNWPDLKKKEWAYLLAPAFFVIYLGLAPTGLLNIITPSVQAAIGNFDSRKDLNDPVRFTEEDLTAESDRSPANDPAPLPVSAVELTALTPYETANLNAITDRHLSLNAQTGSRTAGAGPDVSLDSPATAPSQDSDDQAADYCQKIAVSVPSRNLVLCRSGQAESEPIITAEALKSLTGRFMSAQETLPGLSPETGPPGLKSQCLEIAPADSDSGQITVCLLDGKEPIFKALSIEAAQETLSAFLRAKDNLSQAPAAGEE
jgi:NADH-quinone oxidoreductase subunit M